MRQIWLIFLFVPIALIAQNSKKYDLKYLKANLTIFPYQKKVSGNIKYTLRILKKTDSIIFDAPEIDTYKVKIGRSNAPYKQTHSTLIIYKKFKPGKKYKINIQYSAFPKQAIYFTGWHSGGRHQVWTQGQGKNNSHWLPVNDNQNDKFTWELQINFYKNYRVISNGELIKTKFINDSLKSYTFRQNLPAPAYLIFIGAGKYVENRVETAHRLPIYNYQYSDKIKNDRTYYKTAFIFDQMIDDIGVPYPWGNYKQIPCRDFLYGGMENVSATSFNGDRYVVDSITFNDFNFVNVSAHELAHQWFGDLVTGKTAADHWLHEGFATYYARLSEQHIFGKPYTAYQTYLYDKQIIAAQKTDTIPLHRPNASSLTYYQKGARVVEMLRQQIGDSAYHQVIKNYLQKFFFKNATINDFKQIVYEVTGRDMKGFFNLWLENTAIPAFDIYQQKDSIIFKRNTHQLPLSFLIITTNGMYKEQHQKSFKIDEFESVLSVIANPDNHFLYDVQFNRSKQWIKQQIFRSPSFIDRYKGILKTKNWSEKDRDSVYEVLISRHDYYPIYKEIIAGIKDHLNNKHLKYIADLFKKDLKTRQQIAIQLNKIPQSIKQVYYDLLNDASYQTKQAALWHYWENFPDDRQNALDFTKKIIGSNDRSFRLTWLSLALMTRDYESAKQTAFIQEMVHYSSPEYNMLIRLNAFQTLMELHLVNEAVIQNLLQASLHFNWRLHRAARHYLKELYQIPLYQSIIDKNIQYFPASQQKVLKTLFIPL